MSLSYRQYFLDALAHRYGPAHQPSDADIALLLTHVETHLKQNGYETSVIASEMERARKDAAELVPGNAAPAAPERAAPTPKAVEPKIETADTDSALRKRRIGTRVAIVVAILLAYFTPLAMFFSENRDFAAVTADPGDLSLALRISVVDLARDMVTFQIMPSGGPLLGKNGRLLKDVTVETDPGTGLVSHVFKAEIPLTPWTVTAATDNGDILEFPFDSYEVDLDIEAQSGGQQLRLKTGLVHIPHGLRATHEENTIEDGGTNVVVHVRRTGTIMFVAALAALSLLLVTAAACVVAWQVVKRGRKIEFSMMVWVAALLFVIPTVRNALPGGVPPGALVDFLLFFWLQVAAVAAMGSLVLTWTRRSG